MTGIHRKGQNHALRTAKAGAEMPAVDTGMKRKKPGRFCSYRVSRVHGCPPLPRAGRHLRVRWCQTGSEQPWKEGALKTVSSTSTYKPWKPDRSRSDPLSYFGYSHSRRESPGKFQLGGAHVSTWSRGMQKCQRGDTGGRRGHESRPVGSRMSVLHSAAWGPPALPDRNGEKVRTSSSSCSPCP
jgi:hypothetical protein